MKPSGKIGMDGCSRYSRQIELFPKGEKDQVKLSAAHLLVVGAGGLGSALLPYLVGAGVGNITIVDDDMVSLSNLHRQHLYDETQIGQPKALCAQHRMQQLNNNVHIEAHCIKFTEQNGKELATGHDLIIDCTDNFSARYAIDKISKQVQIPFIYGSLSEYMGQVSVFNYKDGPAYSDLFPDITQNDEITKAVPMLGPIAGVVGSIQALQAINLILSQEDQLLSGVLLLIDLKKFTFRKITL